MLVEAETIEDTDPPDNLSLPAPLLPVADAAPERADKAPCQAAPPQLLSTDAWSRAQSP